MVRDRPQEMNSRDQRKAIVHESGFIPNLVGSQYAILIVYTQWLKATEELFFTRQMGNSIQLLATRLQERYDEKRMH